MDHKTAARASGATRIIAQRGPKPDALDILMAEHRRFEALLAKGEGLTERAKKGRRQLLDRLMTELAVHEMMEEQVLYPALLSYAHTRETLTEGHHEHDSAEAIVNELKALPAEDARWGMRFKALKENLQHHMDHEEQHLFPVARGTFSREQLRDLAEDMVAVRRQQRSPRRRPLRG